MLKTSAVQVNQSDGRFDRQYDKRGELGKGAFGQVLKVVDRQTEKPYAIKKMYMTNPDEVNVFCQRESEILKRAKSDVPVNIVNVVDAWVEYNEFAYILMELCPDNLMNVLNSKRNAFGRGPDVPLNSLELYVSCQLFREMTEGIHFLHSLKPPIMHRDMKPENVLICDGMHEDGIFLKIADFNLATFHEESSHTRARGTTKFMAPEVKTSRKYNLTADIYSLGVIGWEIFFDVSKYRADKNYSSELIKYSGTNIESNIKAVYETLELCCAEKDKRPSSEDLLSRIKQWTVAKEFVTSDENYKTNVDILNKSKVDFFIQYWDHHRNLQ